MRLAICPYRGGSSDAIAKGVVTVDIELVGGVDTLELMEAGITICQGAAELNLTA